MARELMREVWGQLLEGRHRIRQARAGGRLQKDGMRCKTTLRERRRLQGQLRCVKRKHARLKRASGPQKAEVASTLSRAA